MQRLFSYLMTFLLITACNGSESFEDRKSRLDLSSSSQQAQQIDMDIEQDLSAASEESPNIYEASEPVAIGGTYLVCFVKSTPENSADCRIEDKYRHKLVISDPQAYSFIVLNGAEEILPHSLSVLSTEDTNHWKIGFTSVTSALKDLVFRLKYKDTDLSLIYVINYAESDAPPTELVPGEPSAVEPPATGVIDTTAESEAIPPVTPTPPPPATTPATATATVPSSATTLSTTNLVQFGEFTATFTAAQVMTFNSSQTPWQVSNVNPSAGCSDPNALPGLEIQRSAASVFVPTSYSGGYHAELDATCAPDPRVRITQKISTQAGKSYILRFAASYRPGDVETEILVVKWGAIQLMNLSLSNTGWKVYEFKVTATAAETELSFADEGFPNTRGVLLDKVELFEIIPLL